MLLFADGFETFHPNDLWRKWGGTSFPVTPTIVHGEDLTYTPSKLYARKGGRALHIASLSTSYPVLQAIVKPSRSLFVGFAMRFKALSDINRVHIQFMKGVPCNKSGNYLPGTLVAQCYLDVYSTYVTVTWTFVGGPPNKTGTISMNKNLLNGDFNYYQAGMTLMGNGSSPPQAWAEVRIGGRNLSTLVFQNIETGPASGVDASYLMDGVRFTSGTSYRPITIGLDDFYICNDEGDFNNTFLGDVCVRRVTVSGDGTENDSVPVAETYRYRAVDEEYINTVDPLPNPLPDPETTPLFIPWETFAGDYVTLEHYGDKQLIRFHSLNAQASLSRVHGVILNALLQMKYLDTPATITAIRKVGVGNLVESKNMEAPLIKRTGFESRSFVWENEEVLPEGQQSTLWLPTSIDSSEWGFDLVPVTIPPDTYDPAVIRINLVIPETIEEALTVEDFTHRYFEEFVDDRFDSADDPTFQYTWAFFEAIAFESLTEGNRGGNRFLNETLEFSEYLPYTILFAFDAIGFAEDVFVQYIDALDETLDLADWADGFWEELLTDALELTDESAIAFIAILEETFGLEEPYLWDNHELIEDEFSITPNEPWDNHELIEEYLDVDDYAQNGVGLVAEETIGIVEDHHNGNWVEQAVDTTMIVDSILTQHWRYELMFGMVVNSWQEAPVEQAGNDGNHTGDNPWGA
jgi:hypothetical protein